MQITIDKEGSGELYLQIMKAICGDVSNKSMVDIGCHLAPFTPLIGFKERTYVDIQNRPLDYKEEQQFFVKEDMIEFISRGKHFDVSISSDSLEHLEKDKGMELISLMEKYSDKQIVFTPLGELGIIKDNHPDSHKSGWRPKDFKGWASIVMKNFHPLLNAGAIFCWHCENIKEDFERVKKELNA